MFADDTNLIYSDKNPKTLESVVNEELLKVYDWLNANKLTLNIKKSNFVIFHLPQKKLNYQINIKIFEKKDNKYISLERKEYVKYLGILLDADLSWKDHISYVASKISKTIVVIARLRHLVPFETLTKIYRSLIYPYLSYGLTVWGNTTQKQLKKLIILQKRVLRLMHFAKNRYHAIPLFNNTNNLPISMLYVESVSKLMYDVTNELIPENISDLFIQTSNVHSYITRSSTCSRQLL